MTISLSRRPVVNDDVAVDGSLYTVGRRGVAGTVFVHKTRARRREQGAELEEVQRVAQKVIDNVRTMGVAIRPCTVPAAGKPGFELGEDEMEGGIGIHGEPGTHKEKACPPGRRDRRSSWASSRRHRLHRP